MLFNSFIQISLTYESCTYLQRRTFLMQVYIVTWLPRSRQSTQPSPHRAAVCVCPMSSSPTNNLCNKHHNHSHRAAPPVAPYTCTLTRIPGLWQPLPCSPFLRPFPEAVRLLTKQDAPGVHPGGRVYQVCPFHRHAASHSTDDPSG